MFAEGLRWLSQLLTQHNSCPGSVISSHEIFVIILHTHHVMGTLSVLPGSAKALLPTLEEVTQIHLTAGSAFGTKCSCSSLPDGT